MQAVQSRPSFYMENISMNVRSIEDADVDADFVQMLIILRLTIAKCKAMSSRRLLASHRIISF